MTPIEFDKTIRDQVTKIISENMKYRNEMLEELLLHALRGETLVLIEQRTYDGSLMKWQYQWEQIKLPQIPLEEPEDDN